MSTSTFFALVFVVVVLVVLDPAQPTSPSDRHHSLGSQDYRYDIISRGDYGKKKSNYHHNYRQQQTAFHSQRGNNAHQQQQQHNTHHNNRVNLPQRPHPGRQIQYRRHPEPVTTAKPLPKNFRQEEKKILDRILDKDVYDSRMRPRGVNASVPSEYNSAHIGFRLKGQSVRHFLSRNVM